MAVLNATWTECETQPVDDAGAAGRWGRSASARVHSEEAVSMAGTGAGRQAGPRRAVVGVRYREHRHVEVTGQAPQFVLPGHRPPRCAPAAAGWHRLTLFGGAQAQPPGPGRA